MRANRASCLPRSRVKALSKLTAQAHPAAQLLAASYATKDVEGGYGVRNWLATPPMQNVVSGLHCVGSAAGQSKLKPSWGVARGRTRPGVRSAVRGIFRNPEAATGVSASGAFDALIEDIH